MTLLVVKISDGYQFYIRKQNLFNMCVLCKLWKANYFLGKILSKNCKIQIDYKLKTRFQRSFRRIIV